MLAPVAAPESAASKVPLRNLQTHPPGPGSLDHLETNAQSTPDSLQVITPAIAHDPIGFRHAGWLPTRTRIRRALEAVAASRNRLDRWDHCGCNQWLMCTVDEPRQWRIKCDCCHDRFCRPCANRRSRIIANNLEIKLARRKHRLITLTLRSAQEPLADLVKLLYDSFRKLRRSRLWRDRIRGGCCFLEVKWCRRLQRWHPHLHIIAEGQWIKAGDLSRLWHSITRTSYIVDVRVIKDTATAVRYVTKYASKPLSSSYLRDHDRLCEAVVALTGTHLCLTFGCWRRWRLLQQIDDGPWQYVESWVRVVDQARMGSTVHLAYMNNVGFTVYLQFEQRAPPAARAPAETYLQELDLPTRHRREPLATGGTSMYRCTSCDRIIGIDFDKTTVIRTGLCDDCRSRPNAEPVQHRFCFDPDWQDGEPALYDTRGRGTD